MASLRFSYIKGLSDNMWCASRFGTICTIQKREKHLLLLVTLLHGCFSRFLNCTNGTKPRNASHIMNENAFHFIYLKLPLRLILNLILTQILNSPKNYPFFYYVKKPPQLDKDLSFLASFPFSFSSKLIWYYIKI